MKLGISLKPAGSEGVREVCRYRMRQRDSWKQNQHVRRRTANVKCQSIFSPLLFSFKEIEVCGIINSTHCLALKRPMSKNTRVFMVFPEIFL